MKQMKQFGILIILLLTMSMIPFSNTTVKAIHFPYQTKAFDIDALPTQEGKENDEIRQAGYLPNERGEKYPLTKEFLQTFQALQTKEKITVSLAVEIEDETVRGYIKDVAAYLNSTPGFHRIEFLVGTESGTSKVDHTIKVAYTKNQECGTEEGVLGCADGEAIFLDQKATEEQLAENNPYEIQRTLQHELFHVLGFDHTHIFPDNVINQNNQFLSIFEYQEHGQLSEDQYYKQVAPGHSEWKLEYFASDYSIWAQYNNYYEFVYDANSIQQVILYHLNNDGTIHSASVYDYTKQAYTETLMFEAQTKYDMKQKSHQKALREQRTYQPFQVLKTMHTQAPKQAVTHATGRNTDAENEADDYILYGGVLVFGIITVIIVMLRKRRKISK